MADSVRKAFQKLIRSGDMPKTRAEFLDSIETGGDAAKYAFIEALDKLDEKSRASIGGTMQGDGEPWDAIANAAYGAEPAAPSKIRGKDAKAKPEKIERPGPSNKSDQKTLPPTPASDKKAGTGRVRGPGNKTAPPKEKPAVAQKPKRGGQQKPQGPGPLDAMTTPVGTFVPAEKFQGFAEPTPPAAPQQPELGGITYGQTGLPPADPTGSVELAYEGPATFYGDTLGYEPPPQQAMPPESSWPFDMGEPSQMANPALAGLLDGAPMPGNFVDPLSPSFNVSQDMLPDGTMPGVMPMESMPPQGPTFMADTNPATLRSLNPMDMSRLSDPRFQFQGAAPQIEQPQATFDPNWEDAFANIQPASPAMDMSLLSQNMYSPANPPGPPRPGSFEGIDWSAGMPTQAVTPDTGAGTGLGYGGSTRPAEGTVEQKTGAPKSMAGAFFNKRNLVLGGLGVGGLTWAANMGGKAPQGYQEDTSDEAVARQKQRVLEAEARLRALSSGGGM